jgi:hypothetical protein
LTAGSEGLKADPQRPMAALAVSGEIVQMRLFDLGAEVDLSRVGALVGQSPSPAPVEARSPLPPTSKFPQPLEVKLSVPGGPAGCAAEIRVHGIGVVVIRIRWPCQAESLAGFGALSRQLRLDGQPEADWSRDLAGRIKAELGLALRGPYEVAVQDEQYVAYCIHATPSQVPDILAKDSVAIAQLTSDSIGQDLVPARLAAAQKHTMQYTPGDAVILGWDHAVVLDEPGQYEDILDVMELANLELLEFRTYDAHLDLKLDQSFEAIDRLWARGGLFRSARSALRDISQLRVEFARLTDNLYDTGKIFGDWYTAQLHRRLHDRFHLTSWERAVASKMATLEDMFHLAQEETNHRRTLVLEVMVVLLFILDLVLLFQIG